MNSKPLITSVVLGALFSYTAFNYASWLLYPLFVVVAAVCGAAFALLRGGYELRRQETQPKPPEDSTYPVLSRLKVYPPPTLKPTLLSANVDSHLQKVLNLILEFHVIPTYSIVASDQKRFFNSVTTEVWNVLHILLQRVSHVNTIKLISQDVVEEVKKHFTYFRKPSPTFPDLKRFPYLASDRGELEFLRKVVEALLCVCLPTEFLQCTSVRILLREYLVSYIIQPTIDKMCEPDYVNQKLLLRLKQREEVTKMDKKYAYTDYEDFMNYIRKCEDVNELAQIRQSIITDIMQAKAVQHMKESSSGIRVSALPVKAEKAKMLMERNLPLYINQLNTAKNNCERNIRKLGGQDYQQQHSLEPDRMIHNFPAPIPYKMIMENETAFKHFAKYVEVCGYGNLTHFWKAVQDLKDVPEYELQSNLDRIFNDFLSQGAPHPIHVDLDVIKELEQFQSQTVVYQDLMIRLQLSVYTELQQQFHISFVHSQIFKDFMESEDEQSSAALFTSTARPDSAVSEENVYQKRLKYLNNEVSRKNIAIAAMPSTEGADLRRRKLLKDKSALTGEIKRLEHYIDHTEEWFGTVGQWSVEVSSIDMEGEGNDKDPLFILVVHRPDSSMVSHLRLKPPDNKQSFMQSSVRLPKISESSTDDDGIIALPNESEAATIPKKAGWVVPRHLSEFQELHTKVFEFWPDLTFPTPPKKFLFGHKKEKESWKKFRDSIESYMNTILGDPKMQESEDVFNFLSPVSAEMRQSSIVREDKNPKQSRTFSPFPTLPTLPLPLPTLFDNKGEDSVIDHISSLVSEVFDLQDRSRILRKQLYDLAQLTYGKDIDREMQDFMMWVSSEPMLVYYLETFQESMWPSGKPGPPPPVRSDEEKQQTREETKQKFINAAPQTLQTVLGQRNCQIGFNKIFTALQDRHANKQLFYSLLELLLFALVPELEKVQLSGEL